MDFDAERIGSNLERLDRDVAFASLDLTNVCTIQPGAVGKHILGPALLPSQIPDSCADLLLDILHLGAVSGYSGLIHTGYNLHKMWRRSANEGKTDLSRRRKINMEPYGVELILDLKGCDLSDLSRQKLTDFFVQLCDLIDMKRHGEPLFWEDHSGVPHLHGISAIQFIETSNVVAHPLPILRAVYLNVFSCKPFDTELTKRFSVEFWRAKSIVFTVVTRT